MDSLADAETTWWTELLTRVDLIAGWECVDCATVNLSEDGFENVMGITRDVGTGIDVGLCDLAETIGCPEPDVTYDRSRAIIPPNSRHGAHQSRLVRQGTINSH